METDAPMPSVRAESSHAGRPHSAPPAATPDGGPARRRRLAEMSMPVAGSSAPFVMTFGTTAFATATASLTGQMKEAFALFLWSHEQDLQDRFGLLDAQQAGLRDFVANIHGPCSSVTRRSGTSRTSWTTPPPRSSGPR